MDGDNAELVPERPELTNNLKAIITQVQEDYEMDGAAIMVFKRSGNGNTVYGSVELKDQQIEHFMTEAIRLAVGASGPEAIMAAEQALAEAMASSDDPVLRVLGEFKRQKQEHALGVARNLLGDDCFKA